MHRFFLVIILCIQGVSIQAQPTMSIPSGRWRSVLKRPDGREIVFGLETRDSAGKKIAYILNASETLLVNQFNMEGDSLVMILPFFESQIHVKMINDHQWAGYWYKRLAETFQVMPFYAYKGIPERFPVRASKPSANISGRWGVHFLSADKRDDFSVGEFSQIGNRVTGTFLSTTGDDRFLEGVVDGDSLKLSCFDGSHALLFTAKIAGDSLVSGMYYSGPSFKKSWRAVKDPNAKLPDEFSLTKLKPGPQKPDFNFRDIDGNLVSIRDERFRNKVVILQIMGSWCPNCMDETAFLSSFYSEYKNKGVEIIGLAYERSTDFNRSQKSLRTFQRQFKVQYPILITGVTVSDSLKTEKTLPQLEAIIGFPTTIFLNRKGEIEKIHTGFNGPATGEHYVEQKQEFYDLVNSLLSQ